MPLLPFATGSPAGKSLAVDTELLVNCYPVTSTSRRSKAIKAIYGRAGLELFGNYGEFRARGLHAFGSRLYGVFRGELISISNDSIGVSKGTLETIDGTVSMDDNGTQLMVVDGASGYTFNVDTDTFAKITDADFPANPTHVTYLDGFFIVTVANSDQFHVSTLKDGTSWNALDFASAESDPDDLITAIGDHGELWLLGARSTEVWQNTGNLDFTFERLEGAKIQWGIHAQWSLARYADTIVMLGRNDHGAQQVISMVNYQPQRISDDALEKRIAGFASTTDAFGYVYNDAGRFFYVLSFPTGNETWAYDVREGEWHQLKSGITGRFLPEFHQAFFSANMVSDFNTGNLFKLTPGIFADDGDDIFMKITGEHFSDEERQVGHAALQVIFEHGVGLQSGQGDDPQAMLRWSNDNGRTYSSEHWRSIGKVGDHKARAVWRTLGRARDRVYEVAVTDPIKRVVVGIVLSLSPSTNPRRGGQR